MHPKLILARAGLPPKKSLGQNFLYDENVLVRIAGAADLQPHDNVLEIGPGLGALTRHLAQAAGRVIAVELDGRLIPLLRDELQDLPNVEIIHADVLKVEPAALFSSQPYKVVANVPYYITGAILRRLLYASHRPLIMVLTVQQEVAERLTAAPGTMSLLAVSVQLMARPTIVAQIKAGAFWPPPDVDSAVVHLDLRGGPAVPVDDPEALLQIVKVGFGQKRKQLKNNLRVLGITTEQIGETLAQAGVDGRRRAETLSLEEWGRVYEALTKEQ